MTISPGATFEYAGAITEAPDHPLGVWRSMDQLGNESAGSDTVIEDRLVGPEPTLEIADAEPPHDARISPFTGSVRPKVLLSRLTLRAARRSGASAAAFSFCVDRALTHAFQARDVLYITRTGCGGLGVSVVRGGRLVAAVGAVTEVPLGDSVSVRFPHDTIREAELVFSKLDSRFEFPELPIEVRVGAEQRVLYRGRPQMAGYQVFVEHGFYRGTPGNG